MHSHTYLALGDSYTIGESVAPEDRWPVKLVRDLNKAGFDVEEPVIVATTGWTTSELARGIGRAKVDGQYDLVSLLIGVNNQFRGQSIDTYRKEFRALLHQSVALAKGKVGHVIVLSIPDWGVTPFAIGRDGAKIAADIDAFNHVAKTETEKAGAVWIDITPESRKAATEGTLIASDGLHPSGKMYAEWVKLALPIAERALKPK